MARSRSAFSAGTSAVLHVADSALSHSTAGGGRGEGDPARWSSWPSVGSSCHVGERGRTRANLGGPPIRTRDNSRDPAACTQSRGAVWAHRRRPMGYPAPLGRRTLRRVARAAQHRRVRDVERRTARGERHDVVDGQVGGGVGGASVARAPVPVLTTPGTEHAGAEALPGPRAVEGVVPAAVGLARVLGAATARAAGDDTADRAQLHPRIVDGQRGAVYSPLVLRLRVMPIGPPPDPGVLSAGGARALDRTQLRDDVTDP